MHVHVYLLNLLSPSLSFWLFSSLDFPDLHCSLLQVKGTGKVHPRTGQYINRLCGLVVRDSGYRYRGLGFDSRRYQIF